VPSVLNPLHGVRQHPGDDVGIPDGRALPERDLVIAELAEEDAASNVMIYPRPELLLLDTGKTLVQVEPDARPRLLLELPQLFNPAPLRI
jgi:hypothetical protein